MKKSAFLSLVCTLFVLTTLTSCSMTPDMMLEQYNSKLYEDIGGGIYITDGKPNINVHLLPFDTYRVVAGGYLRLEEGKDFLAQRWTVTNNSTGKVYVLSNHSIVYIGRPEIELKTGETYTIQLLVTNRNGVLFVDTATLKVV